MKFCPLFHSVRFYIFAVTNVPLCVGGRPTARFRRATDNLLGQVRQTTVRLLITHLHTCSVVTRFARTFAVANLSRHTWTRPLSQAASTNTLSPPWPLVPRTHRKLVTGLLQGMSRMSRPVSRFHSITCRGVKVAFVNRQGCVPF